MSLYKGLPVYADPRCQPGMIYVTSDWSHLGSVMAIFCHPDSLHDFMEMRWPETIVDAADDVLRAFWREPSNRQARDRAALENARTNARRREMRAG